MESFSSLSPPALSQVLVLWSRRSFLSPLSPNVLREVCSYLSSFQPLGYLTSRQLICYHPDTDQWTPLLSFSTPLQLTPEKSVFTFLGPRTVFVCGPATITKNWREMLSAVYIVDGSQVTQLPSMSSYRYSPGLHFYARCSSVYVFGGAGVRSKRYTQ